MLTIYKRELSSFYHSMIGYLYVAVMLLFIGFYFMSWNLFNGYPQFTSVLLSISVVSLFTIPILTMRSLADERKSRTDQLLFTAPITLPQIVIGKYLAMVTVALVPMLISCVCPLIINSYGASNLRSDYSCIFAFFLMTCVFIAIGLFISSLTESQLIAAVLTFAVLLLIYLWSSLLGFLPDAIENALMAFSYYDIFSNFGTYNVFDLGGIFLYLSTVVLFIFLTVQVLQKRRWG